MRSNLDNYIKNKIICLTNGQKQVYTLLTQIWLKGQMKGHWIYISLQCRQKIWTMTQNFIFMVCCFFFGNYLFVFLFPALEYRNKHILNTKNEIYTHSIHTYIIGAWSRFLQTILPSNVNSYNYAYTNWISW